MTAAYLVTTPRGRRLSKHDSLTNARVAIADTADVIHYPAPAFAEYAPQQRPDTARVPYLDALVATEEIGDSANGDND